MNRNTVPTLDPVATGSGVALSVLVAIGGIFLGFPAIAGLIGVLAGGYLAGRIARRDGLFHGGIVGALTIVAASIAASAGEPQVSNILADTLTIIVSDVLLLGLSSLGGWLATRTSAPSSSSDRGRGR
jgi:uncharacterized membrane protein AbrB (regulator of aidB expression)